MKIFNFKIWNFLKFNTENSRISYRTSPTDKLYTFSRYL